jgi:hypothetical protein
MAESGSRGGAKHGLNAASLDDKLASKTWIEFAGSGPAQNVRDASHLIALVFIRV